jgi:NAD(P)H-flavin reductase
MWILVGIYLGTLGIFMGLYNKLPNRTLVWLQKDVLKVAALLKITVLDMMHGIMVLILLLSHFTIYFTKLLSVLKHQKDWLPGAIPWRSAMFSSAHLCDILMALTILPISRKSLIYFNVSTGAALRFHQFAGYSLLLAVLIHFASYGKFQSLNLRFDFIEIMYNRNIQFGIASLLLISLIHTTSLLYVRRFYYRLFLVAHYCLFVLLLGFGYMHAATNLYWSVPSLVLYTLELYSRFCYRTQNLYAIAKLEESGLITIKVPGQYHIPGQYYLVLLKELSIIPHPFSAIPCNDGLGFVVQSNIGSQGWTDQLYEILLVNGNVKEFNCAIDGPFGIEPFDFNRIDVLVCIVGGSGIAASISLLKKGVDLGLKCYLYWSIRDYSYTSLSVYKDLLRDTGSNLVTFIYVTGSMVQNNSFSEELALLANGADGQRIDTHQVISEISNTFKFNSIGIYTCGPVSLMDSVESSCHNFTNTLLFRESFEW